MAPATSRDLRRRSLLVAVLACLSACADRSALDDAECLSTTRPIADDHVVSELGFSARDVLAWAVRTESQTVDWNDQDWVVVDPSVHANTLEWRLARGDDSALIVKNDCESTAANFSARLQIPARLVVSLDTGRTLDLGATISARRKDFAIVDSAANTSALAQFPMAAQPPVEIVSRRIQIAIDEHSSTGSLDVSLERTHVGRDTYTSPGTQDIFSWPVDSVCGPAVIANALSGSEPAWMHLATRAGELHWGGFDATRGRTHGVSIDVPATACHHELGSRGVPATLRVGLDGNDPLVFAGEFKERDGAAVFTLVEPWRFTGRGNDLAANFPELSVDAGGRQQLQFEVEVKVTAQAAQGIFVVVRLLDGCEQECSPSGCTACTSPRKQRLAELSLAPVP